MREQAAFESRELLGISLQLIFVRGQSLGVPSASRCLGRALCLLHGAKVAKNKPTSGHTNFVACLTNKIDRQEDCGGLW